MTVNVRLGGLNAEAPTQPQHEIQALPSGRANISVWLAVIILVSYAGYFSRLGALGLVGPDEPRYASIARAMERTGDWITPRLNGSPWFEKPVLYYWAAGASFRLFGENDFAARLPSVLAALLIAAAIAWAARRFYGAATAMLALLMIPSSVAIIAFARAATPDMLFTAMLAASMVIGAELILCEKPDIWRRVGFGFFLGAATLAKGPAALVLAGGSVALWALFTRKWSRAFRLAHPLAIGAFLLTALPWYVLCAERNPDFLATFLLLHNFDRFLTPVFHHVQPWWFFLPILVLTILPWSALLLAVGHDATLAKRADGWTSRPGFYFGCWTVFTFIFFSFSKSKLPSYILPAVPPLLLLLAESAARMRFRRDDSARGAAMGLGATWLALAATALFWLRRQPADSALIESAGATYWIFAAAAGGIAIAAIGSSRRVVAALLLNATTIAGLVMAANWILLPKLDPNLTSRATAQAFLASGLAGDNSSKQSLSGGLGVYRLQHDWQYGLEYYLGHPLDEWTPAAGGSFLLFTTDAGCRDIRQRGLQCEPLQKTSNKAWLVRVQAPQAATAVHENGPARP